LEDILTDSGIRTGQEELGQHSALQDNGPIKEEADGLGLEYTNYSPDYSLYQRDYAVAAEGEVVETGRSRYGGGGFQSQNWSTKRDGFKVFSPFLLSLPPAGPPSSRLGMTSVFAAPKGAAPSTGKYSPMAMHQSRKPNPIRAR
jgi:hypothetical protein